MDPKQSDLYPGVNKTSPKLIIIIVVMLFIAGCNQPTNPSDQDIDRVVGVTLTAVDKQAKPILASDLRVEGR